MSPFWLELMNDLGWAFCLAFFLVLISQLADQRAQLTAVCPTAGRHTLDDGDNSRSQSFDVVIDQVVGAEIHTPTLHVAIANEDSRTGGVSQVFKK